MKVLVLYGTNPYEFLTMNEALSYAPVEWEIIVQYGNSKLSPISKQSFSFIKQRDLLNLAKQVDAILCQGGYGSIWLGLENSKPAYVIPRNSIRHECLDDQNELADYYDSKGLVRNLADFSPIALWRHIANDYIKFQRESQISLSQYISSAPRIDEQISRIIDSKNVE